MAGEQEIHISLTPKQIGVVVAILLAGFSAYPVVDMVNPAATSRIDPFTGTDGQALDDRLTVVELMVEHIKDDDSECEERQEALRDDLTTLTNKVVTYQATTIQRDDQQDRLIEQCMHRTK